MPELDYQRYIQGIESNKSRYICDMIALGVSNATDEKGVNHSKIIELMKENRNKDEQINKLNLQIASLKAKLPSADDEKLTEAKRASDAIRASGILGEID